MAKNALVIKGANFAANKLTTVTFVEDEKPCTAIALSETTKSVTSIGSFTLTATVTPADTTDDVLWSSSNETVATVADGVVSVTGLGTATITATCGEQTATCVVSCEEITFAPDFGFFKKQGLSNYPNIFAYATSKRELMIYNENSSGTTRMLKNQTADTSLKYAPIKIPANTAAVTLTYNTQLRNGTIYFGWTDLTLSAYPEQFPNIAALVSLDTSNSSAYNQAKTWTYEVPEGADSFVIVVTTVGTDYSDSDTPEAIALSRGIVVKAVAAVS